jgi:DNA sulfur modification protein DndB
MGQFSTEIYAPPGSTLSENQHRDVISLDSKDKDNRKECTKWIRELNLIRQITAHPEKGVLTTDQVAFVNEIFDKVESCFPSETAA